MAYTVYGYVKFKNVLDSSCGSPTSGYVRPYFLKVDSSSNTSKWADTPYSIDINGYYSFDLEDAKLLGSEGVYKKGTDKLYIAFYWNRSNNNDNSKDSSNLTYAGFIDHTTVAGTDTIQLDLTEIPVRLPVVDTHVLPSDTLLTQHSYTMSETSHLNIANETPICCSSSFQRPITQVRLYNSVNIFDSYQLINTEYTWGEIATRTKANSTSDSYTYVTSGDYIVKINILTKWNTHVEFSKTVRVKYNQPILDFSWSPTQTNNGQIKGQELITFTNNTTDLDGRSTLIYKYEWIIEDKLYDNITDNSKTYTNQLKSYKPTHQFQSPGTKNITLKCYWNDGFNDNVVQLVKQIIIYPYDIVPEFNWNIIATRRNQDVVFTPSCTGNAMDLARITKYDWVIPDNYPAPLTSLYTFSSVDISKFGEGSLDNTKRVDNTYTLNNVNSPVVKFHSIENKSVYMKVYYDNGWVIVSENITKIYTPVKYSIDPVILLNKNNPRGRNDVVTIKNNTIDINSLQYTIDWEVSDFFMGCNIDNPSPGIIVDNTVNRYAVLPTDIVTHYYQNISSNNIKLTIRYDDGWQRQEKSITSSVTPIVYTNPVPDFTWSPNMPKTRDDVVTFTNITSDLNNRHRATDWIIYDLFGIYNPNNPKYGISDDNNDKYWNRVAKSYTPTMKFQKFSQKTIYMKYYFDDGFCEKSVDVTKNLNTDHYSLVANFTTLPLCDSDGGFINKIPIKFINSTTDISNRMLDVVWKWDDVDMDAHSHITIRGDQLPHLNIPYTPPYNISPLIDQEFTFGYVSRKPFSSSEGNGVKNKNKIVTLTVRYDDGWSVNNYTTKTDNYEAKPCEISSNISYVNTVDSSLTIWGQEEIKFILSITDIYSKVILDTTSWVISDKLLSGDDNTFLFQSNSVSYTPFIKFQSIGDKTVSIDVNFDDGWGNIYTHHNNIIVTAKEYNPPILDFDWTPIEPTILETVHFIQRHNYVRPKGEIVRIDIDFFNDGIANMLDTNSDGIDDSDYILPTQDFYKKFDIKIDNINIKCTSTYWNGWENKHNELIKVLNMSNIPPVSSYTISETGYCIPSYTWRATSIDLDDDILTLTYDWKLYKNDHNGGWNLISTHNGKEFSYPFQYEDTYKIRLTTYDLEMNNHYIENDFDVTFSECGGTIINDLRGKIEIESNRYQIIAVPIEFGYWDNIQHKHIHDNVTQATFHNYIIKQIEDIYARPASELIEAANAYIGDDNEFRNYTVGLTPENSKDNFPLTYTDNSSGENMKEVVGFWIKSISSEPIIIVWGNQI